MLNKTNLKEYRTCKNILETLKDELKIRKAAFDAENEKLMTGITEKQEQLENHKAIITGLAKEEYEATDSKKLLGGIGIRIVKLLSYDPVEALSWAKKHDMALSLDKKIFEKIAKTQEMPFVDITEDVKVTFPKEIIFETTKYTGFAETD